jgi:hypothetical protein
LSFRQGQGKKVILSVAVIGPPLEKFTGPQAGLWLPVPAGMAVRLEIGAGAGSVFFLA